MKKENDNTLTLLTIVVFFVIFVFSFHSLNRRIEALEKRAAWFMPEGQQHPEPIKPEIEKD